MNYKEINAENGTIYIGYMGDNLATKVVFPVSDVIDLYGTSGTFELLIKQQTRKDCKANEVYPVVTETDFNEKTVTWIPTAEDTSSGQYMDVELVYTIGEQVVYDKKYRAVCKKSLATNSKGPAPGKSWVTDVLTAGAEAKGCAESANASAEAAAASAESATAAANSANESAGVASRAATTAAEAAAQARTAADSVTMATVEETKTYLGI